MHTHYHVILYIPVAPFYGRNGNSGKLSHSIAVIAALMCTSVDLNANVCECVVDDNVAMVVCGLLLF